MSTPAATSVPVTGAKPTSIKVQPWTDFPRQAYSIQGDDFCHTKPFVAKFTAKGSRSTLNIKETVNKKDGKVNVEDDVKLWFDLPNQQSLYTRVKSTNYIKIHYDHGLTQYHGKQWNMYGSFSTDKTLTKSSIRIGAASYAPKCNSDNRIRVDTSSGEHSFFWYNRTLSTINQFKFGIVSVVDLSRRVLQKNNLLFAYSINNKNDVYLRLQNSGYRSVNPNFADVQSIWDSITLNHVAKVDKTTKVGFQGSFCLKNNKISKLQAVVEKSIPEKGITVKGKLNNKHDVAFLFKRALWGLEDIATLSVGLGVKNSLSEKRVLEQGVQIDFNI